MAGLQSDLDRASEKASQELDKVWNRLFKPEGRRSPRTHQERNEDIYKRLGHVWPRLSS